MDMSRITTLSGSDLLAERSSSFPNYGMALHRYLVSLSTNIQNFIPNLSGLFAMYWVNVHLALDANAENVFSSDQISDTSLFHEICFETWYQGKNEVPNLHPTAHHSQLTCSHTPPVHIQVL